MSTLVKGKTATSRYRRGSEKNESSINSCCNFSRGTTADEEEEVKPVKAFGEEDVRRFYRWLRHQPDEYTEIRAIQWLRDGKGVSNQYFVDDEEEFVEICRMWNGERNVYAGINPRKRKSGKAGDVARVTGIPFDVDPPSPDGEAATEAEREVARERKDQLIKWIKSQGWGEPYVDFSGNGYRVALPVDIDFEDHKKMNGQLKMFFDQVKAEFPFLENITDLPRIIKVPGTWSIKGDDTPERPHRQSYIVQLGDDQPNPRLTSHITNLEVAGETSTSGKTGPVAKLSKAKFEKKRIERLRPCFRRFLKKGGRLSLEGDRNDETGLRWALVHEMVSAGFPRRDILEACKKFEGYDAEKSRDEVSKEIRHIISEGLRPWTCDKIREHGGCIEEDCSIYQGKFRGPNVLQHVETGNYLKWQVESGKILIEGVKDGEVVTSQVEISKPQLLRTSPNAAYLRKYLEKRVGEEEYRDVLDQTIRKMQQAVGELRKRQEKKERIDGNNENEDFDEETRVKARALLRDPAFFYKLGKVLEWGFVVPKLDKPRFVIGEERNKRLLGPLMIGAARRLTTIVKVKGGIGTAKDSMIRLWWELLKKCLRCIERSYMTAASMRYSTELQEADLLYLPDTPNIKGESGRHLRFMRADDGGLMSEYAHMDRETGEMVTKSVCVPVKGVVTSSNAVTGDPALESGMWILETDSSEELTRKVKKEKLKLRAGKRKLFPEEELEVWKCAFHILLSDTDDPLPSIPYATSLLPILDSSRSASRRDPDKLCDLISLIAWMRRYQKPTEKRGEADLVDLFFALQLGLDAITQTISEFNPKEQQIYTAVRKAIEEQATVRYVADETGIPYKTCYRYLEKLVKEGFLNKGKQGIKNVYSVLKGEEPSKLIFAKGRSLESPVQLMEFILNRIQNFSPDIEGGETYTPPEKMNIIDPISAGMITVTRQSDSYKIQITEKGVRLDPPYQMRSSQLGEETLSEEEKKDSKLLPSQNISLEDAPEVMRITAETKGECVRCGYQGAMEFQVTLHDGSWGLLCGDCGQKVMDKLR